jgi:hypothetical protein
MISSHHAATRPSSGAASLTTGISLVTTSGYPDTYEAPATLRPAAITCPRTQAMTDNEDYELDLSIYPNWPLSHDHFLAKIMA